MIALSFVVPAQAGIGQAAMPPAWLRTAGQPAPDQSARPAVSFLPGTPASAGVTE